MDRPQRIGSWVSGAAHGAVLLWAVLGGAVFRQHAVDSVPATEVTTMSESDFEAMAAVARGSGPQVAADTPADAAPQGQADTAPQAPQVTKPVKASWCRA